MDNVTITLQHPIQQHALVERIVLRPPTGREYLSLGRLDDVTYGMNGAMAVARNPAALRGYLEACLVEPKDPLILDRLSLADCYQVEAAMQGFFDGAKPKSGTQPGSSS